MVLDDAWTEGLNKNQQNLVIDYILNEGKIEHGMGGYKSITTIKKFLHSEKGRKAVKKYIEFKFDINKDMAKYKITEMHLIRAFFNPGDIIDVNGNYAGKIESLKQLGKLAYCIEGIESKMIGVDKNTNEVIRERKIKLCDRNKSLDVLERLFKINEEEEDDMTGERSVFEMSNEERLEEIKRLLEKNQKLLDFKNNGNGSEENK